MRFNPEIMPLCRWNREVEEEEEEGGETSSLVISPGRERAFPSFPFLSARKSCCLVEERG